MDTPLPQPITTILPIGDSTPMAKSTATEAVVPLGWVLLAVVAISVVVSAITAFFVVSRLDGQRWIGWTGQEVEMNGKIRKVLLPLFMTPSDLKSLKEGR